MEHYCQTLFLWNQVALSLKCFAINKESCILKIKLKLLFFFLPKVSVFTSLIQKNDDLDERLKLGAKSL